MRPYNVCPSPIDLQWNITQPLEMRNFSPFDSTWMELEGIMLSEVSQLEKDKHYMVSFIGEYKK